MTQSLLQQVEKDLIDAMKSGQTEKTSVLRMLKSSLKNAEISKKPQELSSDDAIKVVRSEIKKRKESVEEYKKANRTELADREEKEAEYLKAYLPPEMDAEKLEEIVRAKIQQTHSSGPSDFGKVMGAVMKDLGNAADGQTVGAVVKKLLN